MLGSVLLQLLLALASVWECDIRVNMCAAPLRKCEFAVKVGVVFIYLFINLFADWCGRGSVTEI